MNNIQEVFMTMDLVRVSKRAKLEHVFTYIQVKQKHSGKTIKNQMVHLFLYFFLKTKNS